MQSPWRQCAEQVLTADVGDTQRATDHVEFSRGLTGRDREPTYLGAGDVAEWLKAAVC